MRLRRNLSLSQQQPQTNTHKPTAFENYDDLFLQAETTRKGVRMYHREGSTLFQANGLSLSKYLNLSKKIVGLYYGLYCREDICNN